MLINYKKSVIRQRKPSEESRSRKKRKALLNCVSTVFSEIERRSAILYMINVHDGSNGISPDVMAVILLSSY